MELTLKGISKKYGNHVVLNQLSRQFTAGVYGLLGANGAGKSTLLNTICGARRPDSGSVHFDDLDIYADLPKYYSNLGFLPPIIRSLPDWIS